jgi:hypothetical protein
MARTVFPCVTTPPFSVIAEYLAKDDDFLADAKAILEIDGSACANLENALAAEKSFLSRQSLSGIVQRILGPETPETKKVTSFIWRVHRTIRRDSDETVERSIVLLRKAISEHSEALTDEQKTLLADRIEKLVALPTGLARQYKAEQLAEATGIELEDLQVICDLRPVFSEERSEIEGAIPISTLKLDVLGPNGLPSRIEVRLTESQVADLFEKAHFAQTKLAAIKKMLEKNSIAMPSTPATINKGNRP